MNTQATKILDLVSHQFGVSKEQMQGKARYRNIVEARHTAMVLMREQGNLTLKAIGEVMNRDHSSVIHALDNVDNWCTVDFDFRKKLGKVKTACDIVLNMKTAYISGPMTGLPDLNKEEFIKAEATLRREGYEVVNPHTLPAPAHDKWEAYMKNDIKYLMDCDVVAVLKDWDDSRGARLEVQIAHALGIEIIWAYNLSPLSIGDIEIGLQTATV